MKSVRQLLAGVGSDLRGGLWPLVTCSVLFDMLALAVLTPLITWMFTSLISAAGYLAISNEQLLIYFLSWRGLLTIVVVATATFAAMFAKRAALIAIAGEPGTAAVSALIRAGRHSVDLLRLALRQVVQILLRVGPLLALGGLAYVWLTAEHDINYLLAARPPRLWIALAFGAVLALLIVWILLVLHVRWLFSIPICLFERRGPREALRESRTLVRGELRRVAIPVLIWEGGVLLASIAVLALVHELGELLFAAIGERLTLAVMAVGLLMAANLAIAGAATFLGFAGQCVILTRLYHALRGVPAPEPVPRRSRWLPWLAAAAFLALAVAATLVVVDYLETRGEVSVTAHRGSSRAAPENSLAAVRQAIRDGADYAEIDVQETADGVVVVIHDTDLMRLAGVNRKIWEIEYDELSGLDAGSWFSEEFKGERVPTLAEVMDLARGRIKLNIEIKLNGHQKRLEERVVELIHERDFRDECVVSSLAGDALLKVRALDPKIRLGYIVYGTVGDLSRLEVEFLAVNTQLATGALIRNARRRGREVHVWTVNSPKEMSSFIDLGVDNILTDEPAVLVDMLAERAELSDVEQLLIAFRNWWQR